MSCHGSGSAFRLPIMPIETDESSIARRSLILRDSLTILSLTLATVVLFVVTFFLFRSFSAHRVDLARRWSGRGQQLLQADKPQQAIVALRTALSYAPGTSSYEQLLAQALGQAGHTEESYSYFMSLWTVAPGDGSVNLQLARLEAKRGHRLSATNFYRASINGTWQGDGVTRRAAVRLELARYLIAGHNLETARMELLIAGGNAPDNYARDMALGDLLQQTNDPTDAQTYYRKAAKDQPHNPAPPLAAGRLAYRTGDYQQAYRLLAHALEEQRSHHKKSVQDAADISLMKDAARILELIPSPTLPVRERVQRTLAARAIAKKRFTTCSAQFTPPTTLPPTLQALGKRWAGPDGTARAVTLLRNPARQQSALQLVYSTEIETASVCGTPTGDDALLLRLANASSTGSPSPAENTAQP